MEREITQNREAVSRLYPHLALIAANVFWGLMSPVTKAIMLEGEIDALSLSAVRIGGGALLFYILGTILPPAMAPKEKLHRKDVLPVFLASLLIISANQGLYIMGISYTSPIDSAVMSSVTPMLTMVLAALVLKIPITRRKGGGVIIGFAGVFILVWNGNGAAEARNVLLGDSLCFAAQLCAAVYYVFFIGLMKRYHPFNLMKWMFGFGALTFVPLCLPGLLSTDFGALSAATWLGIGYILLFATVFSYLTLPYAQRNLRPTVVSVYNYLQPVCSAVASVAMGVGTIGWLKTFAIVLIFAGVWFANESSTTGRSAT